MTELKLIELLKKVEQKTLSDDLKWEKTAVENEFQSILAKSIIRIREINENVEPDYVISIIDKEGTILESISDSELTKIARQSANLIFGPEIHPYASMANIVKKAKRQALGVDKAIDDILSELG